MNVGQDTTLGDGDVTQELVQLLIVSDGELQVTGNDTRLLVVTSGVASQLEDFGSEVLKDGSEVDGSTGTNTLSVVALTEQTVDTADGERQTSLRRTAADEMSVMRKWEREYESGSDRKETRQKRVGCDSPRWTSKCREQWGSTHDCALLEPLALPPDLPPPVILMDVDGKVLCECKRGWI